MKKTMFKIVMALSLMLTSALWAVDKVYLAPVGITGLHQDYSIASSKLMKAYIEDDGRFILVVGSDADSVTSENQERINQIAKDKGCTKFIISEFTRLGENVILSFKLYNVDNEAPIWSDRLKAKDPDDFDPIIQRVARNIGTKKKAANDDDIYTVTDQETKTLKRKGVSSYVGLGIGGYMTVQPEVQVLPGFSLFCMYDAQVIFFGADFNMYGVDGDASIEYYDGDLAVYYPFGSKAVTPYVGGGIAYSVTEYKNYDDDYYYDYDSFEKSGLSAFVGGGVLFNRSSRVLFDIQVKYLFNMYKNQIVETQKNAKGGFDVLEKTHAIHGLVFRFGLGYGF